MKRLIVVLGDLAAGKSTFAKILSDRFNLALINKDDIKEILGDKIGFKNREDNIRLSEASYSVMFYVFEKACLGNADVILEANFHNPQLEEISQIVNKYNYKVMTIFITADPSTLYQRYINRMNNENRNPVHASIPFNDYEMFKEYTIKNRDITPLGDLIKIDGTTFSFEDDKTVLHEIEMFLM